MTKKQQDALRKKLQDKRRALVAAYVTNKNYGRDTEDGDTQDIADKASNAYTKEFLYSLSNTDRNVLQLVRRPGAIEGRELRGLRGVRRENASQATGSGSVGPSLPLVPGAGGEGPALKPAL